MSELVRDFMAFVAAAAILFVVFGALRAVNIINREEINRKDENDDDQ